MLTRSQLEVAARYLCKIRGIHPDNQEYIKGVDHGFLCKAWENAAKEIEHWETMQEVVRYGSQAP
jgi:hypothetical protein